MRGLSPSTLSAVAGVTALVGSFKALTSSVKGALDNFAHFESMQKGLETFFQSAEKGKTKFEELRKLSNETTFGVDELADSFTQLANVGVNVDTINDKLVMLGNISGGNKQKFADLVSIYSKIMSTGKAGSMQIQQLAMRGVPIYDMLKKIGVQGVATGEDITKAFQEMTKEGGQFYNAMNNINDTIEGKEGFISDYFKELTVNFVEVTGIAENYKKVLDVIKDAIGSVSDWLLKINENPVAKAILQGVLLTAISGIAGILVSSLIPALSTIIAKLVTIAGLKTVISGGIFGLVAGGAVALGLALKNLSQDENDVSVAIDNTTESLRNQYNQLSSLDKLEKSREMRKFYNEQIVEEQKKINDLYKKRAEIEELYNKRKKASEGINESEFIVGATLDINDILSNNKNAQPKDRDSIAFYTEELNKLDEQINKTNETIANYNKLITDENKTEEVLSPIEKRTSAFKDLEDSYLSYVDSISEDKVLKSLEAQMAKIKEYQALNGKDVFDEKGNIIALRFTDEQKNEIDKTINYLNKKILEQKINLGQIISWKDAFSYVTGIDVKTNGKQAGEEYYDKMLTEYQKALSTIEKIEKSTGKNYSSEKNNTAKQIRDKIEEQIKTLFNFSNLDEAFESTDSSVQGMVKAFKYFDIIAKDTEDVIEETALTLSNKFTKWLDELMKSDNLGNTIGGMALSSATSASSDFSAFMQGTEQSKSIWGGVINTLISAITNVCREFENFEKVMNPVTDSMRQLKPVLRFIFNLLERLVNVSETFFAGIGALFDSLEPLLEEVIGLVEVMVTPLSLIGALLKLISPLFQTLAQILAVIIKICTFGVVDVIKQLNDALHESTTIKEEENKQERDLTSGYKSLLEAMQNNEEWYLKEKTALNANTRKNSYSVNDMILTPQGNFSTDPNDYIIATKDPSSLNKGNNGTVVNFKVENNANVEVKATQTENSTGGTDFLIKISQKIADDVANGSNGWDSALNQREVRLAGRRIAL